MKPKKTTGRLSFDHMKFIDDHIDSMSIADIAKALNRTPGPIQRYIREKKVNELNYNIDDNNLLTMLHKRHYWKELKRQFNKSQLEFFQKRWVDYYKQFSEDLTTSEEQVMVELCRCSIWINEIMFKKQEVDDKIKQLEQLIEIEMLKPKKEINTSLVGELQQQIAGYIASKSNHLREYDTLTTKFEKFANSLKAERKQRRDKQADQHTNFAGYVRFLESEGAKQQEGDNMALLSKAADRSRIKLAELHSYADQSLDRPLLDHATIEEE